MVSRCERKRRLQIVSHRKEHSTLDGVRGCLFNGYGLMIHVFCFSLGASLFGVGYAAVFVLIMLAWVMVNMFKKKIKLTSVLKLGFDRGISWVALFFSLFFVVAVLSDFVNGGDWDHRDGLLPSIIVGLYIFLGGLIATKDGKDNKKLLETYHVWCVLWGGILLLFLELRYGWKLFAYRSGIFDNINQLMTGVSMLGVLNWAMFLENMRDKRILSALSLGVAVWSIICVLEYSTSDILPFICVISYALVLFLCETKLALFMLLFFAMASSFYLIGDGNIRKLSSADFIEIGYWRRLLNHREEILTVSSRIFSKKPLLGVGAGNFGAYYNDILQSAKDLPKKLQVFDHTHNIWIQHFVAHGAFAGVFFACFLLSSLRLIILGLCSNRARKLSLSALGMFFVFLVYGAFEYVPMFEELLPLVWGTLGLLGGLVVLEEAEDANNPGY